MTRRLLPCLVASMLALSLVACGAAGSSPEGSSTLAPVESGLTAPESRVPEATAAVTPAASATPTATPVPSSTPAAIIEPSPTVEPSPTPLSPGARTGHIRLVETGLALTLPKGWTSIELTADDVNAILDAVPEGMMPAELQDQLPALLASGFRLMAWDRRPSGLGANLTVIAQEVTVPPSLLKFSAQTGLGFVTGISDIRYTPLKIDGVSALRVDYVYAGQLGGTATRFRGAQVYIARPGNLVIVTITIPRGGSVTDRDKIVDSLKLLD
jgi:hypothetical protein